jgi:lysophospholipase L1-like esterase
VTLQFGFNDAAVWDGRGDEEHGRLLPKGLAFLSSSRFVRMVFSFATPWRSPSLPSTATPSARPRLTPAEFSVELQRAVGACRRAGSVPLLVIWPKRSQMRDREPSPYDEALRSLSASVHALLVDLVPVFRAHGAEALFADVVHANVQGNRVAAEAIHEALSRVPKSPQRSQPG